MKVSRRHGRLRMRLDPIEVDLLAALLDQLEALLAEDVDPDTADDVRRRLAPAAYPDDRAAEAEYRGLTAATLRDERFERLAACRGDLAAGGDIDLTAPDAGRRWIQVLNDLRLTIGTRLGVTEDDDATTGAEGPDAGLRAIYQWLTAVQDSVVVELMR